MALHVSTGTRDASNQQSSRKGQKTNLKTLRNAMIAAAAISAVGTYARAQTLLYWDINGTAANSGTSASQSWDPTSTFWNTDSTGGAGGTISAWQPGSIAVFSSGTNFTGTSNITMSGTESLSGIKIEEGTLVLTTTSTASPAASISMAGSSFTITTAVGGKQPSINVPITGSGDVYVNNTSSGSLNLNFDTQMAFTGNLNIGAGTAYNATTRVQLGYDLANPSATINMRNFSALGNDNVVTDPVTGVPVPAVYQISNDIHLNSDNVASCESFIASANGRTVTFSGVISGNSNLNFAYDQGGTGGTGKGTVVLANHETYTGDTFINLRNDNGMVRFGIDNALPTATNVTVGGTSGTLSQSNAVGPIDLGGLSQQWASIGSGTGNIAGIFNTGGATTLTINGTRSTTFKGNIGNTAVVAPFTASSGLNSNISLIKDGTSTLTLTAANSYTGDTTIQGGTIVAGFSTTNSASKAISGNVIVKNAGSALLTAGGNKTTTVYLGGSVTSQDSGTVNPGGANTGTININSDFNLNNNGHIEFDLKSSTDYDFINVAGNFNLDSNPNHLIDIGTATSGNIAAGSYILMQYNSRSWDGTNGLTMSSNPGGAFNYNLDFQDNFLVLNVTPTGPTYRWSVGSTDPATEGGETWSDGGGNFIDLANSNAPAAWSNSYTGDVIFGGDTTQPGGTVTLGTSIVVSGTMHFNAVAPGSPYIIGDGVSPNTLTMKGLFAETPATIAANTILVGNNTWNVTSGVSLTMNGSLSQNTGETDTLTKTGGGALVLTQPLTMDTLAITGGAVESSAANAMSGVSNITIDNGGALREMVSQDITAPITIGSGGAQLTSVGNVQGTMSGVITSAGTITKQGGGSLYVTNTGNSITGWNLAGFASGFQSEVVFSSPSNIGTGPIQFSGGGLRLLAPMNLVNNLTLTSSATTGTGSVINTSGNNTTLSGVITGGGDLHLKGGGDVTITGTNTYQGGALFVEEPATLTTTNAHSLGNATFWPNSLTTLDVEGDLTTAYWRGSGTVIKTGPGKLTAGAVGGVPGGFNEGASLTVNQGVVEMDAPGAFGGRMDSANVTLASSTAVGNQPSATHAQYNITMNAGTELIDNFNSGRYGGSVTLNDATVSRSAGLTAGGEGTFSTYNTWTLNGSPAVTTYLNYGASLTVSGSSTIRSLDTNAQLLAGGNLIVFTMPVNVTNGSTLTVSDANAGGYDNNNFVAFRGVPNSNYDAIADAFNIGAGATVITQGVGQVRFGRTNSDGKVIIGNGTPGAESTMKLSANTYFSDDANGTEATVIGVNGSGNAGLRIEAAMNATYTDRSVDTDPTHHDGTTGLFGANTTNTMEGGTPPTGFNTIGDAFTVMSGKRLNALASSPGGTLTLAANDAAGATGIIDNGPSSHTNVVLALDNTATSGNLVYEIHPADNGGKFENFGGLVINRSNPSAGSVTARVPVNGNTTLYVNSLSIDPTAALDLNDNDLVVNSGVFADIQNLVFTGYRQGADPTATGIISTTGQTAIGNPILALFDNSLVNTPDYPFGSGHTVAAGATVGKYTYIGDTNWDGQVTPDDYGALDANLGATGVDPGIAWFMGDSNFDGSITPDDYGALDANLGLGTDNPLAASGLIAANGGAAVPEPASLSLLGAGAFGLLARRRRRRD